MRSLTPHPARRPGRTRLATALLVPAALLTVASIGSAHDFWLVPGLFVQPSGSTLHVDARSGTSFPEGAAVQPARVADARILGASSDVKITGMTVEGSSLRLHEKPGADGQYLVVVNLAPRTTRSTPAGLLRYLRLEGGAAEADRLERERALAGMDSVVFAGTSYAATTVQLGRGGARAFSRTAGIPLEFVAMNDPAHLHVGDTLHVKVLGAGKAIAGIGVEATPAHDSAAHAGGGTSVASTLVSDARGVVHLRLGKAGPWMLRSAFVARRDGGAANEWNVSRSTYVFNVGEAH